VKHNITVRTKAGTNLVSNAIVQRPPVRLRYSPTGVECYSYPQLLDRNTELRPALSSVATGARRAPAGQFGESSARVRVRV
jgi:hypothetical protein